LHLDWLHAHVLAVRSDERPTFSHVAYVYA
jgi:hypothetical protein